MKKYSLSKYEKILKKSGKIVHRKKVTTDINFLFDNMVIDNTLLNVSELLRKKLFKDVEILFFNQQNFNKVELMMKLIEFDLYIKFTFNDVMSCDKQMYNDKDYENIYTNIDFLYLKKGFRIIFRGKKSRYIDIEAKYLIIDTINISFIKNERNYLNYIELEFKHKIKCLKKWGVKKVDAISLKDQPIYIDNYSKNNFITIIENYFIAENVHISKDIEYFIKKFDLIGCEVVTCGKTYENNFYIKFRIEENKFIQVKFEKIISLEGSYINSSQIDSVYKIINKDGSFKFSVITYGEGYIMIHSKNMMIEFNDCIQEL